MLARKYRITKQADLKKVFLKGKIGSGRFFRVRYLPNQLENPRFTVSASVKVSKKSVIRNRLKRQTREIFQEILSKFSQNFDIIVSISPQAVNQDFSVLAADLTSIFKKNKLF